MTETLRAAIIGPGRIGTFHEFTIAFEDTKPIGILEGDGYSTDEIMEEIIEKSGRGTDDPYVVVSKDPKELVEKVIKLVQSLKEKD